VVLQIEFVMTLLSSVTWAILARARPSIVAPFCTAICWSAMMVPTNLAPVPMVAELPTCQNTLQACAPLTSLTWISEPVISVVPAWKMKTASGSPPPLRVRGMGPVSAIAEVAL
jgi:hypothetical protein